MAWFSASVPFCANTTRSDGPEKPKKRASIVRVCTIICSASTASAWPLRPGLTPWERKKASMKA